MFRSLATGPVLGREACVNHNLPADSLIMIYSCFVSQPRAQPQQQIPSSSQGGKVTDSWESCKWIILEDGQGYKGSQQAQKVLDGESGVS